ncbi:putative HTH-type transcriptional regulator YusO [bacterium HR40]|nr:putative HTH-type transcriptional regulator YusO [bacterium HR40]
MRFVDDYLAYLLARASHLVSSAHHARLARRGVPVGVWRVLATLSDGVPMTVGELAERCLMKQPTLTKLLDRMERDGLVRRLSVPEDRRKVRVAITTEGERRVAPLLREAKACEREVLAQLSEGEAVALKNALRGLLARLEAARGAAMQAGE